MPKHVLFINLNVHIRWDKGCNHGIAYLVPVIRKHGYQVSCITLDEKISADDFRALVAKHNPSIVAFSSTSHHLAYLGFYSEAIKGLPGILQIAGGLGPTLDKEWIFSNSAIQGICAGEGEIPLSHLLGAIETNKEISQTPGFWWRSPSGIKENPIPQFISDLSTLDFPDYSIYPEDMVVQKNNLTLLLSRGCPYDCFFCCNNAKRKLYPDAHGYFRLPPVLYALEMIKNTVSNYPKAESIYFFDDLLVVDRKWFAEFACAYAALIRLPYRLNLRVESVDREVTGLLKKSGCTNVTIGVETGDEHFRNTILNKKFSNSMLFECISLLKESGIGIHSLNMIGLPTETKKQMSQTMRINKKISPDGGMCFYFYPYKGTMLYELCKEKGLLMRQNYTMGRDNFSDRPAIKINLVGRFWCRYYYLRISHYLKDCHTRAAIRRLVSGVQPGPVKLFLTSYYLFSYTVIMFPPLFAVARFLATVTGLRRLRRLFLKSAR